MGLFADVSVGQDVSVLPEERFRTLIDEFVAVPGVSVPGEPGMRGFGSSALKVNGSIFAMVSGGRLVVKLPQDRVQELIVAGAGAPFDAGKGPPMREWLTVTADDEATWSGLAGEALDFVGSTRGGNRPLP